VAYMPGFIPADIQARVQEIRDRVMAKVDEIRSRFAGNTTNSNGILKMAGRGQLMNKAKARIPMLGKIRVLQRKPTAARVGNQAGVSRFAKAGPRVYISDWFFGNSHTLSPGEIKQRARMLGPGIGTQDRKLQFPLEKNAVPTPPVAPKGLSK